MLWMSPISARKPVAPTPVTDADADRQQRQREESHRAFGNALLSRHELVAGRHNLQDMLHHFMSHAAGDRHVPE
jgi:uncharacterized protein YqeY